MKYGILWLTFAALILAACSNTPEAAATPTLDATQQQGQAVFKLRCAQCHALAPDTVVIGPSLAGLATRASTRIEGYSAEEYIEDFDPLSKGLPCGGLFRHHADQLWQRSDQ
jgi:cytochrome c2